MSNGKSNFGLWVGLAIFVLMAHSGAAKAAGQTTEPALESNVMILQQVPKSQRSQRMKTFSRTIPHDDELDKALEFVIPRPMANKMNAIQWTFKAGSTGRPILSGNHYQLLNMAIERGLKRQKRTKAANLGFLDESSNEFNMLLKRQAGDGQLRYGDVIALNLKPYGWLRYKNQGNWGGINLSDDDRNPHYIWQITGGEPGTKIYSGMPFALYNTAPVRTELIFCIRSSGIDLGWRGKSKCNSTLARVSGKVFGANGALSGDGLTGELAKEWKSKLCKAAVGAASAYVVGQTGGAGAAGVAAAAPKALKKCNSV